MKKGDIIYLRGKLPVTVQTFLHDSLVFDHFLQHISDLFCPFIGISIAAKGFYRTVISGNLTNTTTLTNQMDDYTQDFIHHVYKSGAPKHFYCLCICFDYMVSEDAITESVSLLETTYKKVGVLFGKFFKDRIFRNGTEQAITTPESFVVVRFVTGNNDLRFYSDKIPFSKPPNKNPLKQSGD